MSIRLSDAFDHLSGYAVMMIGRATGTLAIGE